MPPIQPRAYPNFIDGNYRPENVKMDAEETINLIFTPARAAGAKGQAGLNRTPGVSLQTSVSNGPGRGSISTGNGRGFVVIGTGLYEYFPNKTVLQRNAALPLAIDNNPATLAINGSGGNQLLVTSGDHAYLLNLVTLAFSEVLVSGATQCGYISGYFIVFDKTGALIKLSDLFNGTTWDPTQFASNTMSPNDWVAMAVNGYSEVWLADAFATQVWIDTGASPFPLAPRQGLLIPRGCGATFSMLSFDSVMIWLAGSPAGGGQIVQAAGYAPEDISDDAIVRELQSLGDLSGAIGWTFQLNDRLLYVLTIQAADVTLVIDRSTGKWFKWLWWDTAAGVYRRARIQFHFYEWNTHIVLDNAGGGIYELSEDYNLDIGDAPIRWLRSAPSLFANNRRVFYPLFGLVIQTGLGTTTGQGVDPQVVMEISDDGGQNFRWGRSRPLGKTGEFTVRVEWWTNGSAYDRAFRVWGADPVPIRIVGAYLVATDGSGQQAAA